MKSNKQAKHNLIESFEDQKQLGSTWHNWNSWNNSDVLFLK